MTVPCWWKHLLGYSTKLPGPACSSFSLGGEDRTKRVPGVSRRPSTTLVVSTTAVARVIILQLIRLRWFELLLLSRLLGYTTRTVFIPGWSCSDATSYHRHCCCSKLLVLLLLEVRPLCYDDVMRPAVAQCISLPKNPLCNTQLHANHKLWPSSGLNRNVCFRKHNRL